MMKELAHHLLYKQYWEVESSQTPSLLAVGPYYQGTNYSRPTITEEGIIGTWYPTKINL
jgi:hypothetical protein